MKKIILLLTGILLVSCSDFLNIEPEQAVSDEYSITDGKSADVALNGVYNKLASDNYHGVSFRFIANLSADNLRWVGNSPSNREFDVHEVFATNTRIEGLWNTIYSTVNATNHLIHKVPSIADQTFSEENRNRILGEALFIRALAYFDLVRLWGGVPLMLTPTSSPQDGIGIARASIDQVYNSILEDLEQAESLLDLSSERNRGTKGAVWALQSEVYLHLKDWEKVVYYTSALIDQQSIYQLNERYSQFYLAKNTRESIFEIDYTINNRNNYAINWLPGSLGGRREFLPTDDLVTLLNSPNFGGDRKNLLLLEQGVYYGNMDFKPSTGIDQTYIFRIASTYLNRAEAYAKLKEIDLANDDLLRIRGRANVQNLERYNLNEIEEQIAIERRLEFAFEGKRWFDLIRTDKALSTLDISNAYKLLFPIPQQLILVDPEILQNEGYN